MDFRWSDWVRPYPTWLRSAQNPWSCHKGWLNVFDFFLPSTSIGHAWKAVLGQTVSSPPPHQLLLLASNLSQSAVKFSKISMKVYDIEPYTKPPNVTVCWSAATGADKWATPRVVADSLYGCGLVSVTCFRLQKSGEGSFPFHRQNLSGLVLRL